MYNQIKKRIRELLYIHQNPDHVRDTSKIITLSLLNHPQYQKAKSIHIYESTHFAVDTQYIINHAMKSSKDIYHPTIDPYDNERNIDLVIIPGLVFDNNLTRHGRGKGYYDRYLQDINAFKCAIAYDFQVIKDGSLERKKHDIPMDIIITETHIYTREIDKFTIEHTNRLMNNE